MTSAKQNRFWEIVGKFSVLVGLLVSVVALYQWANAPEAKLSATVAWSPFALPQGIAQKYRDRSLFYDTDRLISASGATTETQASYDFRHAILEIQDYLRKESENTFPTTLLQVSGMWRVRMHNEGKLPIDDVVLFIPSLTSASIVREGKGAEYSEYTEIIPVGSLRPLESIDIVGWSISEPSMWAAERVKLTHRGGVGSVSFLLPARRWAYFIDNNWVFVAIMLVPTSGFCFIVLAMISQFRRPREEEAQVASDTNSAKE